MDSYGEDDPKDVPRLIQECATHGGQKIIFAARNRRSETLIFQVFYQAYRVIHLLLTGVHVRVGEYSTDEAEPREKRSK